MNVEEIKKPIPSNIEFKSNNPTFEYALEDYGSDKFSYVNGKTLDIENNKFISNNIVPEQKDLNQLVIDGIKIDLYTKEESIKNYEMEYDQAYQTKQLEVEIENNIYKGKVGSLPVKLSNIEESYREFGFEQLRYGYVVDKNNKETLFIQGHLTPEKETVLSPYSRYYGQYDDAQPLSPMRKENVWLYDYGTAFYGKDGQYNEFGVTAIADIPNKKVKVNILENNKEKFVFGGVIDGNTFAGLHNGIQTQGAFYGSEGQDIGGIFYITEGNEKDYRGVFGATIKLDKKDTGGYETYATEKDSLKDFEVK
ncbi:transferrin-binding protein-like solute binding protein [Ursidibacter sp. B-7004-1]